MVFMLLGQRWHMDKADLEERLAKAAPAFSRAAPLFVGVFSILTLVLAGNLYVSPPTFQTDLNDFSPKQKRLRLTTAFTTISPTKCDRCLSM